jgi:transcriptional regulator with GAF, ATPase, and Fis domain
MDGELDLAAVLIEVTTLVAHGVDLVETLERIAEYSIHVIKPADAVVLTVFDGDHPEATVARPAALTATDDLQYGIGEGPAVTALAERRVIVCDSLDVATEWPRFRAQVTRMGLHSVLAVPLALGPTAVGSLSLYAERKGSFTDRDTHVAERFGMPAAAVARNAQVVARARIQLTQLQQALEVRPVIDQAIGIMRGRSGRSAEEALERLKEISSAENLKVSEVSARIVQQAVRRANSRRGDVVPEQASAERPD